MAERARKAAPRGGAGERGGAARGAAPRRGRAWVALGLVCFVALAAAVIFRRSYGIEQSQRLRELDRRRVQLVGEKAALESEIRVLSSRSRLGPVAEQRLGMRVPADSEVVLLRRTAGGAGGP